MIYFVHTGIERLDYEYENYKYDARGNMTKNAVGDGVGDYNLINYN